MAGIVFPDLAGSLIPALGVRRQLDQDAAQREVGQYIPAALEGDRNAFARVATLSPQHAMALQGHFERMDAQTRAKAKDELELTARTAAGILSLPEQDQPAAYEAAYQQLKGAGYSLNGLPPQWHPALKQRLQASAIRSGEFLKMLENQPQAMPMPGGAPGAASGPAPANQDEFIRMMAPHALAVSQATGLDPRLVLAQSALETNWGKAAPGNNYFGIKSHGRPGGQDLPTSEVGAGGLYQTRDSFRTYGGPGQSAQDYADFLKTNGRYAPVLQAQGLDAQIDAMGKSGYATDPAYGAKLRQIAGGIQLPGSPQPAPMPGPPTALANAGTGAAPMPSPPPQAVGALPGNPAPMPGGAPGAPQVAQGDSVPGQGLSPGGKTYPTTEGGEVTSDLLMQVPLPPGARYVKRGGKLSIQGDRAEIVYPDGRLGYVAIPKPKEPQTGLFPGNSVEANALNQLVATGVLTPQQALELAAGKVITDPSTGQIIFKRPTELVGAPGATAPGAAAGAAPAPGAGQPAAGTQSGTGGVPLTPPKSPVMPKEQADLRTAKADGDTIINALEDFRNEFKKAGFWDKTRSMFGASTPLNTSYNAAALLAKGEALFNLGVLNGPDLEIIRRTIADPSTMQGRFATEADMNAAIDKVQNLVKMRIAAREKQLGVAQPDAGQAPGKASAPVAAPKVGDVVDGYLFKGGDPSARGSWEKVQ